MSGGVDNVFFFFSSRRRHTRFDCDWSSDVCSSDLSVAGHGSASCRSWQGGSESPPTYAGSASDRTQEIGRASCRERGEISVVAGSFKKKTTDSYMNDT